MLDENAGVENATLENAGSKLQGENAKLEKEGPEK